MSTGGYQHRARGGASTSTERIFLPLENRQHIVFSCNPHARKGMARMMPLVFFNPAPDGMRRQAREGIV